MKRIRLAWGCACLCLVLGLSTRSALAQVSSEGSPEAHVRRGLELRRTGDDAAALAEFERAQVLAPALRTRAQIALALQALGRWPEAEEVELEVLSDDSDPWVREHRSLLEESLATAQHHLAWLLVQCNVDGAELLVNGRSAGKLPLSQQVRVVAGAVVFQVRANGYESVLRTIDVPEGSRARESVVLVESMRPVRHDPEPRSPALSPPVRTIQAPARSSSPEAGVARRNAAGWATLAVGGALAAGGIASAVVGAAYAGMYNDDKRCFVWPLTRDERCGVDRGIVDATRTTAIVALATGAAAVGVGALLVATSTVGVGRAIGLAVACSVGLASLRCAGQF